LRKNNPICGVFYRVKNKDKVKTPQILCKKEIEKTKCICFCCFYSSFIVFFTVVFSLEKTQKTPRPRPTQKM